jgi:D-xylose transport system ATP-binding protein
VSEPLLRLSRVTKRFGAVEAVVDFDLELFDHEVVALVGDNAAGKSTVARIVAGDYQADAGVMALDGVPTTFASTADAYRHGVATVFQTLALAENLDVTANIFLGREVHMGGLLAEEHMESLAREYLARLNARIPSPRTPLSQLSAGQRQCVAIARTLVGNPKVIVLDEPTASLSVSQTAEVLSYIQSLRELGLGVMLISHSLNDVLAVADRIEVIRHGRNNGSFEGSLTRYEDILSAITGATRWDREPRTSRNASSRNPTPTLGT